MKIVHAATSTLAKATNGTLGVVRVATKRPKLLWPASQSLPVAGLDVLRAQSILFSLRNSLTTDQGTQVVQAWLHALQLCQVASDRLLHALSASQRSLKFWQGRLAAGGHSSFMLLSRGPGGFLIDVLSALKLRQSAETHISPSDRIEERIVALQLLSTQLAEALADVHNAAALLRLTSMVQDTAAAAAAPPPDTSSREQQPELGAAVAAAVSSCLAALTMALHKLLPNAARLQEHEVAARQVQQAALHQTLAGSYTQSTPNQPQPATGSSSSSGMGVVTMQHLQQQVADVSGLLGTHGHLLHHWYSDARSVLAAASMLSAQLGPLVSVPHWARMPSSLQRHWIKYSIAAGLGVSAGVFLYRHSWLCGSSDLEDWAAAAVSSSRAAWADHVVSPLLLVRDELFKTFRDRPSIVSTAEFEADKQSLLRMLEAFQQDYPGIAAAASVTTASSSSSNSSMFPLADLVEADAVNQGMQVVMRRYEADLKQPMRNLLTGELARTLLIQVQRMKLDGLAAMLEMDQILRANELSISLVAAVPALLVGWGGLRGLWALLSPAPPDPLREALPCRMGMAELERALATLAVLQHEAAAPPAAAAAAEGMVLFQIFKVYREAQAVYRLKDRSSKFSEWPHLQADLLELSHPGTGASAKLELHRRMLRTYTLLQA